MTVLQAMQQGREPLVCQKLFLFPFDVYHYPNRIIAEGFTTIDLLNKIACCEGKINYIFIIKNSCSELVSSRRSTVLILALQRGFPGVAFRCCVIHSLP